MRPVPPQPPPTPERQRTEPERHVQRGAGLWNDRQVERGTPTWHPTPAHVMSQVNRIETSGFALARSRIARTETRVSAP
jgi:hypothetical protein